MSEQGARSPLVPPWSFARRFEQQERERWRPGMPVPPHRSIADPLVLLAWHQLTEVNRRPIVMMNTSI